MRHCYLKVIYTIESKIFNYFQKMYNQLETTWKHQTNQETVNLYYNVKIKLYLPKHLTKTAETLKCFEKTIS